MCGIAGIIDLNNKPVSASSLFTMTTTIKHRGPDDEGFLLGHIQKKSCEEFYGPDTLSSLKKNRKDIRTYQNTQYNFGFGHRRLSIIDLTFRGHQPMYDRKKNIWIVFNGEIYNYKEIRKELTEKGYKFISHSDTEVIIYSYQEWGEQCLHKFNGIFSFMIWDKKNEKFFFARDRLGVKPFYYYNKKGMFIFASEIKAILSSGLIDKQINSSSIYSYIKYKFVCNNNTFLDNIYKLLPGYYGIIKNNRVYIKQYWDIKFNSLDYTEGTFKSRLRELFEDAIQLQIRSDVPIGAHLSGGIDSSSVVSMVKRLYQLDVKTFSGAFNDAKEYSEENYITLVKKQLNIENYITKPTSSDFMNTISNIVYYLDEPVVGPGVFPQFMVNKLIHKHLKVVLGGQGGDEIFAGYYRYFYAVIKDLIINPKLKLNSSIQLFHYLFNYYKLAGIKGIIAQSIYNYLINPNKRLNKDFKNRLKSEQVIDYHSFTKHIKGCHNQLTYWDIKNFLQGLLQVEDRTSMAFSIESRVPLLDHRFVELAVNIPIHLKLKKDITKYIFRESIKDLIPDPIYQRKDKHGFPTPFVLWLKEKKFQDFIYERIFNKEFLSWGVYCPDALKKIWKQQTKKGKNKSVIIWELLNLSLWYNNYIT